MLANLAGYADLPVGPRRIAIECAGVAIGPADSQNFRPEHFAKAATRSKPSTFTSASPVLKGTAS